MNPLISVVMPVWNGLRAGKNYLHRAVFSLVRQDYEGPIEIIVVDDGSTDRTLPTLYEWANKIHGSWQSRRLIIESRPHEGVTHSLNHGLRQATSEFVARQDADDWSEPSRFTRQVEFLSKNTDVAMVGSAARVVHDDKVRDEVWYRWGAERIPKKAFRDNSPFCHGSVMFRRSMLQEIGEYDPKYPHAQDYDLFWRIACRYPVATISDPLYAYRVHGGRVTSNRRRFRVQLQCAHRIKTRIQRELRER